MQKVSLIKGKNRRANIRKSLELLSDEIKNVVKTRQLIIKPNFVSTSKHLAASHVDQIRGILDFLQGFYQNKVIIAEAAAGDTMEGYKNFGYLRLQKEYDVNLIDLNKGPFEQHAILDKKNRTIPIRVASLLCDRSNYVISAAKLKTHDTVVVTLSIKNMAMGCSKREDKPLVHQGIKQTNLNIAKLAKSVWPDLAVIDGFIGMGGQGPIFGKPIDVGVALSSTDSLAADKVACKIMGIDFAKVGYLSYCSEMELGVADLNRIEIIGHPLEECIKPFTLHSTVKEQYKWKE
jgi:uncharacterized protein (DUF362 family)